MSVTVRAWRDGRRVVDCADMDRLDQLLSDPSLLVHLDLQLDGAHDRGDLDALARELGFADVSIEDVVAPGERVKLQRRHGYFFLTAYATSFRDPGGSHPAGVVDTSALTEPASPEQRPAASGPDVEDAGGMAGLAAGETAFEAPRSPAAGSAGRRHVLPARRGGGSGTPELASRVRLSRVSTFILRNGLVTVRQDGGFDMDEVTRRWEDDPQLLAAGVGALTHGLLDAIVDGHFAVIQTIDDSMEALEDLLFADGNHVGEVQRATYRLRKELVQLRRAVLPMREVVNMLTRPGLHNATIDHELAGQFDDLYDHVLRAAEWTESLRDMIGSIFETNLSLQDSRLNIVMKKLAGWAAVIAVPTAVTGWFGQNVPYPGFQSSFGLWQAVVLMVVGTVGIYALFRHKDWI